MIIKEVILIIMKSALCVGLYYRWKVLSQRKKVSLEWCTVLFNSTVAVGVSCGIRKKDNFRPGTKNLALECFLTYSFVKHTISRRNKHALCRYLFTAATTIYFEKILLSICKVPYYYYLFPSQLPSIGTSKTKILFLIGKIWLWNSNIKKIKKICLIGKIWLWNSNIKKIKKICLIGKTWLCYSHMKNKNLIYRNIALKLKDTKPKSDFWEENTGWTWLLRVSETRGDWGVWLTLYLGMNKNYLEWTDNTEFICEEDTVVGEEDTVICEEDTVVGEEEDTEEEEDPGEEDTEFEGFDEEDNEFHWP